MMKVFRAMISAVVLALCACPCRAEANLSAERTDPSAANRNAESDLYARDGAYCIYDSGIAGDAEGRPVTMGGAGKPFSGVYHDLAPAQPTLTVIPTTLEDFHEGGVRVTPLDKAIHPLNTLQVDVRDGVTYRYIRDTIVSIDHKRTHQQLVAADGTTTFSNLKVGNYDVTVNLAAARPAFPHLEVSRKAAVTLPGGAVVTATVYLMPKAPPDPGIDIDVDEISSRNCRLRLTSAYKVLRYHITVNDAVKKVPIFDRDLGPLASPIELELDNLQDGRRYNAEVKAETLSQVTEGDPVASASKTETFTTVRLPDFFIERFEVAPTLCAKEKGGSIMVLARIKVYRPVEIAALTITSANDLLYEHEFPAALRSAVTLKIPIPLASFSGTGEREVRLAIDFGPGRLKQQRSATVLIAENSLMNVDIQPQPENAVSAESLNGIMIRPAAAEKHVFERCVKNIVIRLSTSISGASYSEKVASPDVSDGYLVDADTIREFMNEVNKDAKVRKTVPDMRVTVRAVPACPVTGDITAGERVITFPVFADIERATKVDIMAQNALVDGMPFEFFVDASSPARFTKARVGIADAFGEEAVEDISPAEDVAGQRFEMKRTFKKAYAFKGAKARIRAGDHVQAGASLYYPDFNRWSKTYYSNSVRLVARDEFDALAGDRPQIELVMAHDPAAGKEFDFRIRVSYPADFQKASIDFGDGTGPVVMDARPPEPEAAALVECAHTYKKEGKFPLSVKVFCGDYNIWSAANEFYEVNVAAPEAGKQ